MEAWSFITSRLKNLSLQYNHQFVLSPFSCCSPGKFKLWWLRGKDGGRRDKVAFLCELRVRVRKYHLALTIYLQVNININVLLSQYCETSFLLTLFFLDSKCPLANFLHMLMCQGYDKRE